MENREVGTTGRYIHRHSSAVAYPYTRNETRSFLPFLRETYFWYAAQIAIKRRSGNGWLALKSPGNVVRLQDRTTYSIPLNNWPLSFPPRTYIVQPASVPTECCMLLLEIPVPDFAYRLFSQSSMTFHGALSDLVSATTGTQVND